ncbi:MAG: TolC family protein [Phycisphaeraceae bacterium]
MRMLVPGLFALSMLPQLGGCGASPLAERWPERRPLGRAIETYRPPREPDGRGEAKAVPLPEPNERVSLRKTLALALMHHPDLAAAGWEVRAAEARTLQAGLLPNPELGVEVEDFAGSGDSAGFDAVETTVSLSQLIELGGDREARIAVARHGRDLSGWDYEARRVEILTETAKRYLAVLAAQRRAELAEQVEELVQQTADTIDRRVEAGEESSLERTRFRVQTATARLAREQTERELAAARQRLAAMWGDPEARFGELVGELPEAEALPDLAELVAALEQNPRLAMYASAIALRQAETDLAKARGVPDITVGAGVRHFNESDDVSFLVGASVPLPLFDRNQGEALASRFEAARALAQQEATRVRLHTQLVERHQELILAYEQTTALRDEVLPAAREAFEGVQAAFDQGEIGLLDLLDAQRTLTESQSQYADALSAYHQSLAAMEGLVGQPLADLDATSEQPGTRQEQP